MVYISTKDNGQYSQLHIENYAQAGAGVQGLQTLYLSNDASISVTANPVNSWVVSKIEGERNSANGLYGIWMNIDNGGAGIAHAGDFSASASGGIAKGIYSTAFSLNGQSIAGDFEATSTNNHVYGIQANASGSNAAANGYGVRGESDGTHANNYGIYGTASGATQNYAGYFNGGNVRINNRLLFGKTSSGLGKIEIAEGTTSAFGIWWGTDVNLYRSAFNFLKTDDNLIIVGTLDAPTLNTGEGDNELFDMNQNVETGNSPTFVNLELTGTGLTIEESASPPAHSAGHGKYWVHNGTSAPPRYTTDDDQDLYVVTSIERTSAPSTPWPGRIYINTSTNRAYIYADSGWREIAAW